MRRIRRRSFGWKVWRIFQGQTRFGEIMKLIRNKWALGCAVLFIAAGFGCLYVQYREFMSPPRGRLEQGAYYPEMPPDALHHYLRLPIDHFSPASAAFSGFYILSPGFKPGAPTVLVITDGQQELVSTNPDTGWFTGRLGAQQYALLAGRGHAPTLFPEVFRADGSTDHRAAMNLYGAAQQVEDIEDVRLDMLSKGLLPAGGKVMLYGASGGGALAQQYMGKYGANVSRALLESTGGVDIARGNGLRFTKNFKELNPAQAEMFAGIKGGRAGLAFMLFKLAQENRDSAPLRESILKSKTGFYTPGTWLYLKYLLRPGYNWPLIKLLIDSPSELAVRVRMYELLGADLKTYGGGSAADVNLMYEWCGVLLRDFQDAERSGEVSAAVPAVNRAAFSGEVLVFSGTMDHVFTQRMGRLVAGAYKRSAFASFEDIHRLGRYPDYYREFRQAFFAGGLSGARKYFSDARQLEGKAAEKAPGPSRLAR